MIPYGRQSIDEDDVAAVMDVLRGEWLTQGPTIETFERMLADQVSSRHAVAFSSGTAALHAAGAVARLSSADLVATSPLSFVASANLGQYAGARVHFVDIEDSTLNLNPEEVPDGASALVAVHFAGLPVDLDRLSHRPAIVIEDAAHALGARTEHGPVGSCSNSEMCVFSFHPVKAITTAEGGAVTTNSDELAQGLRRFRNHGIVRYPDKGGWYYEVESLGFNYRLTDIQAALGISQLRRLSRFVARRNELAERYRLQLAGLPLRLPPAAPPGQYHAYHLFPIRVSGRRRVYQDLRTAGIGVQVHYVPIYRHPIYAGDGEWPARCPVAERTYEDLLSLPLYPGLEESDQDIVVQALEKALC